MQARHRTPATTPAFINVMNIFAQDKKYNLYLLAYVHTRKYQISKMLQILMIKALKRAENSSCVENTSKCLGLDILSETE